MDLQSLFARALAAHQAGRLEEAQTGYLQLLAVAPNDFAGQLLLGILRAGQGRSAEALALIEGALKVNPDSDLALLNHGNVLDALGRRDAALAAYDRALTVSPASVDARNNRGVLLWKLGRLQPALADLDAALRLDPAHVEALTNRGHVLRDLGRPDEALASYDRALALRPAFAEALANRAKLRVAQGRFADALADYDALLAQDDAGADLWNDRGIALQKLERMDEAVASYDRALAIRPDHLEALNNRGNAQRERLALDAALADFDRVIALSPDDAQANWSKSIVKLTRGEVEEGLALYEWRKRLARPIEARAYPQPLWTGTQAIAGKTLFLYIEQGLGDTIQFYRYARMARDHGARVALAAQDTLGALLRDAGDGITILGSHDVPETFDFHAPLMSLPLAFITTLATIPAPIPYLRADPQRVAHWKKRIGAQGFKIGVCWQGAASIAGRAFPLHALEQIARRDGVRLISLQTGEGAAQRDHLPSGMVVESLGAALDAGPDGFLDSAAAMESLDLVISADTALVHLAGALGCPVWVALKQAPDWRWFLDRNDSPWYPAMRLFRQAVPGDWTGVFAAMARELDDAIR